MPSANLGVAGTVLESTSKDDYLPNLVRCAQDGSELTIAAGFLLADRRALDREALSEGLAFSWSG